MADDGALTLHEDLSEELRDLARARGYNSPEAVVREALAEWKARGEDREVRRNRLQAMIQVGLDDIAAGRVTDFDAEEIIAEARAQRLAR